MQECGKWARLYVPGGGGNLRAIVLGTVVIIKLRATIAVCFPFEPPEKCMTFNDIFQHFSGP